MSAEIAPDWAEVIEAYLLAESAGGAPPSTLTLRRTHLGHLSREIGCNPTQLTAHHLVTWFGQKVTWKAKTRYTYRTTVRSFVRWAFDAGHLTHRLDDAIPTVRRSRPSPRAAPDAAFQTALAAATPRVSLMLRLAAEAGLRRGEIARIHARDLVDTFRAPRLLVHGKGAKDRLIPISEPLANAILTGSSGHTPGAPDDGWLFPKGNGGHLVPTQVGLLAAEVLPHPWTLDTLRHRFATQGLLRQPQPPRSPDAPRPRQRRHHRALHRGRR